MARKDIQDAVSQYSTDAMFERAELLCVLANDEDASDQSRIKSMALGMTVLLGLIERNSL